MIYRILRIRANKLPLYFQSFNINLTLKQPLPQILALPHPTKTRKQSATDMRGVFGHFVGIAKGVLNHAKLHGRFLKRDKK